MRFFADENISPRAVRLLEAFDDDCEIRALEHFFDKGTPDTEWLSAVASWSPKPVVLGGDGRILRNKVERATLRDCDLMFVYLAAGWTKIRWQEFAWKIIKAWPSIVENVSRALRPTVYEVKLKTLKIERIRLVAELAH